MSTNPDPQDSKNEDQKWHRWFAWRPTVIDGQLHWFKFVYRRESPFGRYWGWEYIENVYDLLKLKAPVNMDTTRILPAPPKKVKRTKI